MVASSPQPFQRRMLSSRRVDVGDWRLDVRASTPSGLQSLISSLPLLTLDAFPEIDAVPHDVACNHLGPIGVTRLRRLQQISVELA